MAEAGRISLPAAPAPWIDPVTLVRVGIITGVLVFWEALARSGLLYRDVVPSLFAIGARAGEAALDPGLLLELGVTAGEVGTGAR